LHCCLHFIYAIKSPKKSSELALRAHNMPSNKYFRLSV
jgi:hypothetical protein